MLTVSSHNWAGLLSMTCWHFCALSDTGGVFGDIIRIRDWLVEAYKVQCYIYSIKLRNKGFHERNFWSVLHWHNVLINCLGRLYQ